MRTVFFFLLSLFSFTMAEPVMADVEAQMTKPSAVRFYATWCSRCKVLDAKLEKIRPNFADQVNFVVFEMTNEATKQKAVTKAKELGLEHVYNKYHAQTGLMVLVDAAGQVVQPVTYAETSDDIRQALSALTQ